MRVVWTPEAVARLDDIEAYIAQDSPANAKEMVARLLTRTRQLETAALSGREVPSIGARTSASCWSGRTGSSTASRLIGSRSSP